MAQKTIGVLVVLGFVFAAVGAQAQNYDPIREEGNKTQKLINEMSTLIDAAERDRAADRRFLRDLRSVLRRFDNPWQIRLLTEDFRDGDYQSNPKWTVESGEFFITRRGGLHSEAIAASSRRDSGGGGSRNSSRETALGILTEILRSSQSDRNGGSQQQEPPPRRDRVAAIYLTTPVTNAFAITAEISAPDAAGALELVVYQGADREVGYRLVFLAEGGIELLRDGRRGSSVIDFADNTAPLGDGFTHVVEWSRSEDGQTVVRLDATVLIETRDRSFRDPFDGFEFVNRGGEYVLRSLTIDGTN